MLSVTNECLVHASVSSYPVNTVHARVFGTCTTRVHGPCRQAVFMASVNRRPWTRPVNTGVQNDTDIGQPSSRPVNTDGIQYRS